MTGRGETYVVELRAVPGEIPGIIRLRRFLKAALRSYQLVAGDVREVSATAPQDGGQGLLSEKGTTSSQEVTTDQQIGDKSDSERITESSPASGVSSKKTRV